MSSAHRGGKHRRRVRVALPTAAATLLIGGAGAFMMAPAHATGAASEPARAVEHSHDAPSRAELTARLDAVLKDVRKGTPTSAASRTVDPKIIGGTPAGISSAPWMAQLWYSDGDGSGFFCGGAVIAPTKILTAAHCVAGVTWSRNNDAVVITGTDQLLSADAQGHADLHGGTPSGVWRQWSNPSFDPATTDNDVAVLTLANPVSAPPLRITTAGDTASYKPGTQAQLYGWGRTSSTNNDTSPTLQTATMPIDADSACQGYYGSDFVAGHMLCVGTPASGADAGTVSACNGDSGGPLVVGGRLVGVVSWGVQDCVAQGAYSVFSKVSAYAGAIDQRVDDTDISGDGLGDVFARTPAGSGYEYDSKGGTLGARQSIGGWGGLTLVRQADLDRDGYQDFLERTSSGVLYREYFDPAAGGDLVTSYGGGWNAMKVIAVPGDLTGDGLADLLTADTGGKLYLYAGNGKGGFGARKQVGYGWNTYGANIFGHGDFTGDGRADVIGRDSAGNLWLYKGTGSATTPFSARVKIGYGYAYTAYLATGDTTGDGRADLVTRDSAGNLWLYKGTGSATKPLSARVKIGYGWNIYDLFG